jgi:hypothetical protein
VLATLAVLIAFVGIYFIFILEEAPAAISAVVKNGQAYLTLQTDGSWGNHPYPDWVTYMAKDASGQWKHTTIWDVPPHTIVHVTLYQFDSQTGLRNNFLGQVRGTVGNVARYTDTGTSSGLPKYDDTALSVLNPNFAAHTFTAPDLNLSVPLLGISNNAPANAICAVGPCGMNFAHTVITFSFKSPGKGNYRWQCIVPCAFAFLDGFGGPMQTIGYMDGWIQVT